jgi:hypothetical protein
MHGSFSPAAALDYRFGWRWLLPPFRGTVRFSGFDEAETRFWLETYPGWAQRDSLDELVDLLLVRPSKAQSPEDLHKCIKSAKVVVTIAEGAVANDWRREMNASMTSVREYALLPVHNPRVVVPLSESRHAVSALALHRPGRRLARWGVGLARLLARIGNYRLLRGRVLLIAMRGEDAQPQSAWLAGLVQGHSDAVQDFALYLGTPDDNRKTVVLPLGTSQPRVLLKVAGSECARVAVRNETAALEALAQTGLATQVPKVIRLMEAGTVVTLHQEYRPRAGCQARGETLAVTEFLRQLSEVGGRFVALAEVLACLPKLTAGVLPAEVEAACLALEEKLHALADSGFAVWVHRVHGDFAPWNCVCTRQGFFVYDWEGSRGDGMALGDAFYYTVAPVLLMRRNPDAGGTLEATLNFARKVMTGRLAEADPRPYLALWLLARVHRAPLYGGMAQVLAGSW